MNEIKIEVNGEKKTFKLGRVKMKHAIDALKKSTSFELVGGEYKNVVDYVKQQILECLASIEGETLTYEQYRELYKKDGDALIDLYRKINYGGDSERTKFQEGSLGGKN